MKISFSPVRSDEPLALSVTGDVLTLNGDTLDLSGVPDGATLPAEAIASVWITGPVERTNGVLHLTVRLPHGPDASEFARFPGTITVTADGAVALPTDEVPA